MCAYALRRRRVDCLYVPFQHDGAEISSGLVRARVLAAYLLYFRASVAIGSALWGYAAEHTSVRLSLVVAGIGIGAMPATAVLFSPFRP